ncbi:SGT1-domain-containing protein [Dothidotthia symphoricarpi CBS 119687]|uniref:SGT1-domain-containing protein n=1 Tax=Dothidotthia symphoricarpi CBS 119687 TaxID=1392245 RepID=A0A6A6AH31_9PLEO|nr:SGT1-domain-containing protein [Dothidotthia symphoricarpi CBS 119687]KAF2129751.1 SGT1-domain-containing protein [Dothidotthia symphoricarpi CBS 119687]
MAFPQDDLKWFGEGFDGFPKKLPEDVVEYLVFVLDAQRSDTQTRERLQAFQRALNTLEKKFLKEYIWQRDPLKLDLVREEGRWLLRGQTNYGDSVADEWLIVYLLRELSKEFKDAWIRIYDSDGEFLLIEAANVLPKWLNPEVAENRVWINAHRLLIVPLGKGEEPAPLKQDEALKIIFDTPARPQQYPNVEKEAFHRLKGYPLAISENQHHATLPLPRVVAHVLNHNPAYIASIVEAFYLRDPVSIRLLQPDKTKTQLIFPPEDFVDVSVRFTKVLYAQLLGQHWDPPDPWIGALEKLLQEGKPSEKSEIGVKVTAGMEMLVRHTLYADRKSVREISLLIEDLENGDDTLPTNAEITAWPKREDDEGWLNIDFSEFEKELAGKGGNQGFGDKAAQENLKKMVERFNDFLNDDEAGIEGAGVVDPMDVDNDSDAGDRGWEDPEDSDSSEKPSETKASKVEDASDEEDDDADADEEFAEYEQTYEKFMMLSAAEKALLTEDARELALAQDAEQEEDEEIKKLSNMMEAELFGHGALNLNTSTSRVSGTGLLEGEEKPNKGKGKVKFEDISEDDEEEEDEEEGLLDDDYNLADNMLKAFKGQDGMAGPAGNMMKLMGIQFPQDADDRMRSRERGKNTSLKN